MFGSPNDKLDWKVGEEVVVITCGGEFIGKVTERRGGDAYILGRDIKTIADERSVVKYTGQEVKGKANMCPTCPCLGHCTSANKKRKEN